MVFREEEERQIYCEYTVNRLSSRYSRKRVFIYFQTLIRSDFIVGCHSVRITSAIFLNTIILAIISYDIPAQLLGCPEYPTPTYGKIHGKYLWTPEELYLVVRSFAFIFKLS